MIELDLGKAWIALGRDPEEVISDLCSHTTVSGRAAAAQKALEEAEKTAKALMARYHPDRNPDSPSAATRFMTVKNAIDTIRMHTEKFRTQAMNNPNSMPTKVIIKV